MWGEDGVEEEREEREKRCVEREREGGGEKLMEEMEGEEEKTLDRK